MPKIAHISYFLSRTLAEGIGVYKKLEERAAMARNLNLNIDFVVLNREKSETQQNLKLVKFNIPANKYRNFFHREFLKYETIRRSVNLTEYDRVVLRYPLAAMLGLRSFLNEHGSRIITEHHTDEISELESLPFEHNINGYLKPIRTFAEKHFGATILSRLAGIIAVTDEIRELELARVGHPIPAMTLTNGIHVDRIPLTGFKPFRAGEELTMLLVANNFSPWQGLSRLIHSLREYSGETALRLVLIGLIEEPELAANFSHQSVAIDAVGSKYGEDLEKYFRQANLGISTMALYTKKMRQACSLKTREYIARGLPFIYAYDDPDLEEDTPFALSFQNDTSVVDFRKVVAFAQQVSRRPNLSEEMRRYAEKHLSLEVKVRQMYDFAIHLQDSAERKSG